MTLEEFARNPARFEGGKWRFPNATELRENWFLPSETEREIDKFARARGEISLDFEALAIAFYRVGAREKSSFWARKMARESATLLQIAQILEDDEIYIQEMARAGFATLNYFGYWENIVKIGGPRLQKAVAQIERELAQTSNIRGALTLRKLLSLADGR